MTEIELIDRLARMDTKLDLLVGDNGDHEARLRALEGRADPPHQDHETRIRRLEQAVWRAAGAAAAGGGTVASLVLLLVWVITGGAGP